MYWQNAKCAVVVTCDRIAEIARLVGSAHQLRISAAATYTKELACPPVPSI